MLNRLHSMPTYAQVITLVSMCSGFVAAVVISVQRFGVATLTEGSVVAYLMSLLLPASALVFYLGELLKQRTTEEEDAGESLVGLAGLLGIGCVAAAFHSGTTLAVYVVMWSAVFGLGVGYAGGFLLSALVIVFWMLLKGVAEDIRILVEVAQGRR